MKKIARKSALIMVATVATAGLVLVDAPAHADTGWGWRVGPHSHSAAVIDGK